MRPVDRGGSLLAARSSDQRQPDRLCPVAPVQQAIASTSALRTPQRRRREMNATTALACLVCPVGPRIGQLDGPVAVSSRSGNVPSFIDVRSMTRTTLILRKAPWARPLSLLPESPASQLRHGGCAINFHPPHPHSKSRRRARMRGCACVGRASALRCASAPRAFASRTKGAKCHENTRQKARSEYFCVAASGVPAARASCKRRAAPLEPGQQGARRSGIEGHGAVLYEQSQERADLKRQPWPSPAHRVSFRSGSRTT